MSSALWTAGLFLSSILTIGEVGRRAEGEVATGMRDGGNQAGDGRGGGQSEGEMGGRDWHGPQKCTKIW